MKFKVGDRVVATGSNSYVESGWIGTVNELSDIPFVKWDNGQELCIDEDKLKLVKDNQTIIIYRKDNEVIASLKEGKKAVKTASAKCNPKDEFNFEIGAKLAFDRLMGRDKKLELNITFDGERFINYVKKLGDALSKIKIPSFDWEGFKQGKFAVHCDTEEKAVEFLKECDTHGIKWCSGSVPSSHTNFINYKENTAYRCDGRLDRLEFCYVEYFKNEGMHIIDFTPSKPTINEVKRPAKVGEWVKVLSVDWFTDEDCKVGDIFKAVKPLCEVPQSDGAYYDEDVNSECKYISFGDYVVLENYQPEDKPFDSKPVQPFKKAKVGDKIKVVNERKYGHINDIELEDSTTITSVDVSGVFSENRNYYFDTDQEYIILETTETKPDISILDQFTQDDLIRALFKKAGEVR